MSNKHPKVKAGTEPRSDLVTNPHIGDSKGAFAMTGEDPKDLDGGSTVEGDVMNQTTAEGGVDPAHRGRTNK